MGLCSKFADMMLLSKDWVGKELSKIVKLDIGYGMGF